MDKLLTLPKVAQRLGISRRLVEIAVARGDLAVIHLGSHRRVSEPAIQRWLASRTSNGLVDSREDLSALRSAIVAEIGEMAGPILPHQRGLSRALDLVDAMLDRMSAEQQP